MLFWIAAFVVMLIVYGYSKTSYLVAARNNLFYTPVHMLYFYTLAYWLIPCFLLKRKYVYFFLLLPLIFLSAIYITRIVDVFFVEPYIDKIYGSELVWYPEHVSGFWQKVFDKRAFFGALKGVNLIVWVALAVKLFKLLLERRNAALEAELNFLKGQIHPHFLFNTLNNLYGLTLNKSDKSPEVVLKLSGILRYMLYECNTESIELKKEVGMITSYLELEKIRYGDRLEAQFSVNGDCGEIRIAPLLMLNLVENAFKHGTSDQLGACWVNIDLQVSDKKLKLKVSNSQAEKEDLPAEKHYGNIGLSNTKKRLDLLYPDAHRLKFFNEEDMFLAVLELDLER